MKVHLVFRYVDGSSEKIENYEMTDQFDFENILNDEKWFILPRKVINLENVIRINIFEAKQNESKQEER